jgi:outer membrane protein assembly factor BamD (BamD/ComL family)
MPSPRPTTATPLNESTLMLRLRSAEDGDPDLAIELAREGNRRFPDSPDSPERSSILIHALAGQGDASEARAEAEDMVNRYPDSSWVREIERFTGAHRHRNIRLTDAGSLEYY